MGKALSDLSQSQMQPTIQHIDRQFVLLAVLMCCLCLQEGARTGAIEATAAATLTAALVNGSTTPLDALTAALGMGAGSGSAPTVPGTLTHDYEFAAVELVKPTRMNKVGAADCSFVLSYTAANVHCLILCFRAGRPRQACCSLAYCVLTSMCAQLQL